MDFDSIDEPLRRRFEQDRIAGMTQPIEDYLPAADALTYLPTLEELVHIEFELLGGVSGGGTGPLVETFLTRFPALNRSDFAVRLVRQEYQVRWKYSDRPTVDEYRARFPQWITSGREVTDEPGPSAAPPPRGQEAADSQDPRGTASSSTEPIRVEPVADPPQGRRRYELSRLHAEGGLARIWVARDNELHREVALKELKPEQAAVPGALWRFIREAQVAGQLEHPNIVPVYDFVRDVKDRGLFYTMRLVRGQTLHDAAVDCHGRRASGESGSLEMHRLLQAFLSVCHAVSYAHSRGVIHRDLKPQNVVLGSFGEVLVLDWGLAKLRDERNSEADRLRLTAMARLQATAQGAVLGSPAYMSPEQAKGDIDAIDARTDVYGLGAILFEILTGQPPHRSERYEALFQQIVSGPTPRPVALNPSTPKALDAICAKAMGQDPEQRYQHASDLADDLNRYLADEPVVAYHQPWWHSPVRWLRKHATWVLAAATALAVAALLAAILSRP